MQTEVSAARVLSTLKSTCQSQNIDDLPARLDALTELVRWDMADVDEALSKLRLADRDDESRLVFDAADVLLGTRGKRLRPMCVALAARLNGTFDERAKSAAVAVELVHTATLLHDDVVDEGTVRRGLPAPRTTYGNAASVFAGDALLIEALRRVHDIGLPDVTTQMLTIIDEMIHAESLQLESRGDVDASVTRYFDVVRGKTAALFRFAIYAGARIGGSKVMEARELENYGEHLGIAFQLIDDLLDYAGDGAELGKDLFADLREGKLTYPLLHARDNDPRVRAMLKHLLDNSAETSKLSPDLTADLADILRASKALEATRQIAESHAARATAALEMLSDSKAKSAFEALAIACIQRER